MKRLQRIFIPNSQGDTFEAIELVGTGLAIYYEHNPFWKRDECYLIHIASGSRLLGEFVCSFVSACLWVRRIKDLTDWTQPADRLKPRYDVALLVQERGMIFLLTDGKSLRAISHVRKQRKAKHDERSLQPPGNQRTDRPGASGGLHPPAGGTGYRQTYQP